MHERDHRPSGGRSAINYLRIDRLKPDPKNARRHSAKQTRQLANSIEAFGFDRPKSSRPMLTFMCQAMRQRLGVSETLVPTPTAMRCWKGVGCAAFLLIGFGNEVASSAPSRESSWLALLWK